MGKQIWISTNEIAISQAVIANGKSSNDKTLTGTKELKWATIFRFESLKNKCRPNPENRNYVPTI